ncbi:MAG: saccharopine dehydrogenase family protein, partial [Parasphingopyxis sp.]
GDLDGAFVAARPDIVIHTTGPFQRQGYQVAEAAIAAGAHYLDLADARRFVCGIAALDKAAREAGLLAVSGASSVPCLTAAIVDHYAPHFAALRSLDYGISAAQQTNRGLATARAVLGSAGKPFTMLRDGRMRRVFGWQDLHAERYPALGRRWLGNCDIPDLDLFPRRYPALRNMRFAAGHELALLHFGTWGLSWLVRARLMPSLDRIAPALLSANFLFDALGSGNSGFHMHLDGINADGTAKRISVRLVAGSGHGPLIPCMPAILLARRLARGEIAARGAMPCLDLVGLPDYLTALEDLDITLHIEGADPP